MLQAGCDHCRLREPDGRNPEGQLATGRRRYLWGHRHALGEDRGPDRSGVWQVGTKIIVSFYFNEHQSEYTTKESASY